MKNYYVEGWTAPLMEHGMDFFPANPKRGCICTNDHIHEQLEYIYVINGEFRAFVNDSEYMISSGDVLFIRSNAVHRIYALDVPDPAYYVLKINVSAVFELATEKRAADYVLRLVLDKDGAKTHWRRGEEYTDALSESFEKLICEYTSQASCRDMSMKLWASSVILHTLRSLISQEPREIADDGAGSNLTAQIYRVIKHINRHYAEPLDAEECARKANMSYSYFSRSFKRITGKSFKEYLNFVRVSHAEQLLYSGDKGITEIAMECGYNNVSYFISVYKKMKGQTPLKLRKKETAQ